MTPPATLDFGGSGPPLHLAHANGYPPAAYRPLAEALAARCRVTAMVSRPLWSGSRPGGLRSWQPLADDLGRYLDQRGARGWVGVGHSLGAVITLDVALRRPEFFSTVVLIDPVMLSPVRLAIWNLIRRLGQAHRVHPYIPGALKRRRRFDSVEAMYLRFRRAPVFSRISDLGLRCLVESAARPIPGEPGSPVELAYPPEWEVAIYKTGPLNLWPRLAALQPPLLVIRGAETDTFWPSAVAALRRRLPRAVIHNVPGAGHLVPFEQPEHVAGLIFDFLDGLAARPGAAQRSPVAHP